MAKLLKCPHKPDCPIVAANRITSRETLAESNRELMPVVRMLALPDFEGVVVIFFVIDGA